MWKFASRQKKTDGAPISTVNYETCSKVSCQQKICDLEIVGKYFDKTGACHKPNGNKHSKNKTCINHWQQRKKPYLDCHCDQCNVTVWWLLIGVGLWWIDWTKFGRRNNVIETPWNPFLSGWFYLDESCLSAVTLFGGDWFSVLMPWWWLLFMWLLSLLLCGPTLSVLLWITTDGLAFWLSFGIRFDESVWFVDVDTVVMFKSVNRVSYIEYGDLNISHPIS